MSIIKSQIKYKFVLFSLVLFVFLLLQNKVLATAVDRMSFVNLEGNPGETIITEVSLEGTEAETRSGFWYVYYKSVDGDNKKMDISSWITIEPSEYQISEGEIKKFTVKIKIPTKTEPGLWGAISKDAGREGYSNDRRTYIVFKDSALEGNVYSGLLLPVSVNVLGKINYLTKILDFAQKNIIVIVLVIVILILSFLQFRKKFKSSKKLNK